MQPFLRFIRHKTDNQMLNINKIIQDCKQNKRSAQKKLYDVYSPIFLGICLRYAKDKAEAEDMLQDGFIKIFTKISKFSGKGSFEGWMKRIIINTSITSYHKNKKYNRLYNIDEINEINIKSNLNKSNFSEEELLKVIRTLPKGYNIIFNLYAIEGYKHKEIAQLLNISINTSKSQYSRAKKLLRKKLEILEK